MAGGSNNNSVEINVPKSIGYAKASSQKNATVEVSRADNKNESKLHNEHLRLLSKHLEENGKILNCSDCHADVYHKTFTSCNNKLG